MTRTRCAHWRWQAAEDDHGVGGLSNPYPPCGECMECYAEQDRECDAGRAADAMELHEQDHAAGRV